MRYCRRIEVTQMDGRSPLRMQVIGVILWPWSSLNRTFAVHRPVSM